MKLIGTMGSPFVRRVAISLELYEFSFENLPLSVFADYAEFAKINAVVKAPTVILEDGTQLMESSLILNYLDTIAPASKTLFPREPSALAQSLSLLGVILAACEKAVQFVYEHRLRPVEKQHADWINRVTQQLLAACHEWQTRLKTWDDTKITQVEVTSAVAWQFIQTMIPDVVNVRDFPVINALSDKMAAHPAFQKHRV